MIQNSGLDLPDRDRAIAGGRGMKVVKIRAVRVILTTVNTARTGAKSTPSQRARSKQRQVKEKESGFNWARNQGTQQAVFKQGQFKAKAQWPVESGEAGQKLDAS